MVTTAGGFDIPFAITIKKRELESTIGMIGGFNDFLRLINESYDEALILFLSKVDGVVMGIKIMRKIRAYFRNLR